MPPSTLALGYFEFYDLHQLDLIQIPDWTTKLHRLNGACTMCDAIVIESPINWAITHRSSFLFCLQGSSLGFYRVSKQILQSAKLLQFVFKKLQNRLRCLLFQMSWVTLTSWHLFLKHPVGYTYLRYWVLASFPAAAALSLSDLVVLCARASLCIP